MGPVIDYIYQKIKRPIPSILSLQLSDEPMSIEKQNEACITAGLALVLTNKQLN